MALKSRQADQASSSVGQPEVAEGEESVQEGAEQANVTNSVTDRRHSLGDDQASMTIEFLRARLLSERSASKSAKQRAQSLAKRVVELEHKLEFEIGQRKKAEAAILEALSRLKLAGLVVDSSTFSSFSAQVATVDLEGRETQQICAEISGSIRNGSGQSSVQGGASDEGSGKQGSTSEENSSTQGNKVAQNQQDGAVEEGNDHNRNVQSSSEDDVKEVGADVPEFQAQQKPIAWKGKTSNDDTQTTPEAGKPEAIVKAADVLESPKRRNGRSLRRIQKRETRVVEERLKGVWDRLGEEMGTLSEGRNEDEIDRREILGWMGDVVNILHNKSDENPVLSDESGDSKPSGNENAVGEAGPIGAAETKGSLTDRSFEKLFAEYEAEEKAQRLWEKQYHAKQQQAAGLSSVKQNVEGPSIVAEGKTSESTQLPQEGTSEPQPETETTQEKGYESSVIASTMTKQEPEVATSTSNVVHESVNEEQEIRALKEGLKQTVVRGERFSPPVSELQVEVEAKKLEEGTPVAEEQVIDKATVGSGLPLVTVAQASEPLADTDTNRVEHGFGQGVATSDFTPRDGATAGSPAECQEHDPRRIQDGFYAVPRPGEHHNFPRNGLPASSRPSSAAHDFYPGPDPWGCERASTRPDSGGAPEYNRGHAVGGGPDHQPSPEFESRGRLTSTPPAPEHSRESLYRSQSQNQTENVGYSQLEYRPDNDQYAYGRHHRSPFRSGSPMHGAEEQRMLQRSKSITHESAYRSPETLALDEREWMQRSRSFGPSYSDEPAHRGYDNDGYYYEKDRAYRYETAESRYNIGTPHRELDYGMARQKQVYAAREPPYRGEYYPGIEQMSPDTGGVNTYERDGRVRQQSPYERNASPGYSPADYVTPQRTPRYHDQPYPNGHLAGREAYGSVHGNYLTHSYDCALAKEGAGFSEESLVRRNQPEFPRRQGEERPLIPNHAGVQGGIPVRAQGLSRGISNTEALANIQDDILKHPKQASTQEQQGLADNRTVRAATGEARGASADQSQSYLALPSYAGEGEVISAQTAETMQDHQTATNSGYPESQQQSLLAKGRENPSQGARPARDGTEEPKPILALPSYAGEGLGTDVNPQNDSLRSERQSLPGLNSDGRFLQPDRSDAYHAPSRDQEMLRNQRLQMIREAEPHRSGRFEAPAGEQPHLALPSYAGEGAAILEREAMRRRLSEEQATYDGMSRARLSVSEPNLGNHPALRENQQRYVTVEPHYGSQGSMKDARLHGFSSSNTNLYLEQANPSIPSEYQAPPGNLAEILRALQIAKDKIQSSATPVQQKSAEPRSQPKTSAGLLLPRDGYLLDYPGHGPSPGPNQPVMRREDLPRLPGQEHLLQGDMRRSYALDGRVPFLVHHRSTSTGSVRVESPVKQVSNDGNTLPIGGLPGSYVDKLNVGKGIQFFFP